MKQTKPSYRFEEKNDPFSLFAASSCQFPVKWAFFGNPRRLQSMNRPLFEHSEPRK